MARILEVLDSVCNMSRSNFRAETLWTNQCLTPRVIVNIHSATTSSESTRMNSRVHFLMTSLVPRSGFCKTPKISKIEEL
ncbi:hypothetical protein PsorP6_001072 [Peronosclerospora sorghi]|uniref:Uncharacterized protein n=1 Tax=Peronosclerospora sorghi TaxID=230839 RepID=A0ACC0WY36_9STRA|nr:hypothetical protein PsorP6_001072 [Peronosclerospora sorghi]